MSQDRKLSECFPSLKNEFGYCDEPGEAQEAASTGGDRPADLVSMAIKFPDLEPLVVIVLDPAAATECRDAYPDQALWSIDAFERFISDLKTLDEPARQQQFLAVNQVKAECGGTYEGLIDRRSKSA